MKGTDRRLAGGACALPCHRSTGLLALLIAAILMGSVIGCTQVSQSTPTVAAAPPSPTVIASAPSPTTLPLPITTPQPSPSPSPSPSPMATQPQPSATPTKVAADGVLRAVDFSADLALAHIMKLSQEIGSRPAGSEGERKAREYVANTLSSCGYTAEFQAFGFTYLSDLGSTITVLAPEKRTIQAYSVSSPRTPEVTADLVTVGLGRTSDYQGRGVSGKIVLVQRGEITFREKADNAQKAGAAGAIIYNNAPGSFFALTTEASIPVVTMAGQDGQQLLNQLRSGSLQVTMVANARAERRDSYNVIGKKPGSSPKIVVGAHFDSVSIGPGANDNASGVGAMLEIARLVAKTDLAADFVFVAFGAEENGLLGSQHYVSTLSQAELQGIRAMVNLDMVAEGSTIQLHQKSADSMANRVAELAKNLGISVEVGGIAQDSDHASFAAAGVPVIELFTGLDPYYHSSADTVDKLSTATLGRSGRVALLAIGEVLQNLDSSP